MHDRASHSNNTVSDLELSARAAVGQACTTSVDPPEGPRRGRRRRASAPADDPPDGRGVPAAAVAGEAARGGPEGCQQSALEAKEAERLRALAEKGQIEEALAQQRKAWEQKHAEAVSRYTQLEQQVHAERKNSAIAEAFHGRTFVGETPEQKAATAAMVRRLLQDDFETTRDASGALVVREKVSGRPAAEVLRERLDSPQFAIFFAPSSRGGSGTEGTRPPASLQPTQPGSLEAIVSDWRNRQTPVPVVRPASQE